MDEQLMSVIVMCYNNEVLLDKTIESILSQTYKNIEIIISDDCSKNYDKRKMQSIALKCQQKTKQVIINHNENNIGTVKHFNKLIKMANGSYIIPLSCGDEFYSSNVLSRVNEEFQNCKALVITGVREGIRPLKARSYPTKYQIKILKKDSKKILQHLYKYADLISGSCTYYKKDVFQKYGYFDEQYKLLEDCPYYIKLLENNISIQFVNDLFIRYDMNGVSTGEMHPLLKEDMRQMFVNILENANLSFFSKRVVKYRIQKLGIQTGGSKLIFNLRNADVIILLVYNRVLKRF
ncbi:glycosyltransferase involved in cell wall biosynthesis [Breznakia sp. PF5-3]|uniref:glycosyltransferase n=1 Tax=unclassified Breznakia TaxID=2623764 RepID=UPI0024075FA1|nr:MULTISPECIES: glycosyltransferase [unclassified Breznakia]MDF9824995.1 glycosyltransferase involved in cell wall biosynthesis [Breznakia sp. PM6-1]MDF9835812.1 glycosyltransferase involved in cell wall biosynthesis [Breznakia sp. PF5-3]MDF9836936.1 glycosyltransferase involved in cell wall biosynthesis [Breznakia sp. PFB2-8]MDF9859882.1 glycosyltransferase involved in cell wall biosynthesis [Breznakia sp. PH5-24]